MFDRIAPRYDATNSVLSMGQHRRWRRKLVKWSQVPKGGAVLDVATGTGDLAFLFQEHVGEAGRVIGLDFSKEMLVLAREKAHARDVDIEFREGDALNLPFPAHEFDVASIAFGIRNVDDPTRALQEMARVVRPGGRVAVLEFGQPRGIMRLPYAIYSRAILPIVGGAMTGDRKAYRYLQQTSAAFPSGPEFEKLMHSTGAFGEIKTRRLSAGIVYAYVGTVAATS
jgi:demethylmenaquinone methyltransferase / 2-methoxy-6-polyprenyl-1,4-benzoquinol methylase